MYECPTAEHHTMLILGCCQVWTCGRALLEMSVCADGTVGMHTQKIMNEKHTLKELPWSLVMKDCTVSEEWIQQLKQIHFFFSELSRPSLSFAWKDELPQTILSLSAQPHAGRKSGEVQSLTNLFLELHSKIDFLAFSWTSEVDSDTF